MSTTVPPTPNTKRGRSDLRRTPSGTASAQPAAVPTQELDRTQDARSASAEGGGGSGMCVVDWGHPMEWSGMDGS
jgi:hypothetical protein